MEVCVAEVLHQEAVFRCVLPTTEEAMVELEQCPVVSAPSPCFEDA